MISWIKGEIIHSWQLSNKFFVLINCQDLGYEIQILESFFIKLNTKKISDKNITLWLKHIKKEESDSLYGFISKDQKDFFVEIINIRGVGAQIGMALLNKYSINQIMNAIFEKDKKLISSVPGIGQKMTERILLELQSKLSNKLKAKEKIKKYNLVNEKVELNGMLDDINLTLQSLNYPKKEISSIYPKLLHNINSDKNKISFENLLKQAMNLLDNKTSDLG